MSNNVPFFQKMYDNYPVMTRILFALMMPLSPFYLTYILWSEAWEDVKDSYAEYFDFVFKGNE